VVSSALHRYLVKPLELSRVGMMVASLKCYRLQAYACSMELLTTMTLLGPGIFSLR
jgi:hypothetical protein